jgi:hypothetical protein
MTRLLFLLYDFTLVFGGTFIADKTIHGFSYFYFTWLLVLIRRGRVEKNEIYAQFILVLFTPVFFFGVFTSAYPEYYNYYFQAIFYITFLFFIKDIFIKYTVKEIYVVCLLVLSFFTFGTFLHFLQTGGGRGRIIFGPNVIYRILSFVFGFYYSKILFQRNYLRGVIVDNSLLLIFTIFLFGMVLTGSRGAFLVSMLYFFIVTFTIKLKYKYFVVFFMIISVLSYVVYVNWDLVGLIINRMTQIDLTNNSEAYRFQKYTMFFEYLAMDESIHGLGNINNFIPYYPHNFFLELIFYCGIFSFLFLLPACLSLFIGSKSLKGLYIVFAGVLFGSLVSGNMQYNYPFLSILAVSLIIAPLRKKRGFL